jgi:hypothetical protein
MSFWDSNPIRRAPGGEAARSDNWVVLWRSQKTFAVAVVIVLKTVWHTAALTFSMRSQWGETRIATREHDLCRRNKKVCRVHHDSSHQAVVSKIFPSASLQYGRQETQRQQAGREAENHSD